MRTPTEVKVGQMWRDNDARTRGNGEFTVVDIRGKKAAVIRHGNERMSSISISRLLTQGNTQRGYTYLGMSK